MSEITTDSHWECECERDFIHVKAVEKFCPKCHCVHSDQPDAIKTEVTRYNRWPEPTVKRPPMGDLYEQARDGAVEATDGCAVEPDGVCEHGHPSWLLKMGLI